MKIYFNLDDDKISYPYDEDYSKEIEEDTEPDDEELPQNLWRHLNKGIVYKHFNSYDI